MSTHETRRDPPSDPPPTRRDPSHAGATRRDDAPEAEPADRLRRGLPTRLADRFETIRELPAGGAEADILLVRARDTQQPYIAKIYRLGISPKFEVLDQVSAVAVDHVVRRLEHGESDGRAYELLEYAEYGSLRTLIDREGPRLSFDTVMAIVRELAAGLAAVHAVNVVHRDLKPENVLVVRRHPLDLVLTDFGISSVIDASMRFSVHQHRTIAYAAPETSASAVSPALDYWSLGMIIAEALLGHHPLGEVSEVVMLRAILTRPVPIDDVPGRWRTLCEGLLTRDDQRRWGAAEVARWIEGDNTIPVAGSTDEAASAPSFRGYRFGGRDYRTLESLAEALATNWQEGQRELERGYLRRWASEDLQNLEVTRVLDDLDLLPTYRRIGSTAKLSWVTALLGPRLTPSYEGLPITSASLGDMALRAYNGERAPQNRLETMFDQHLLVGLGHVGGRQWAAELGARWLDLYRDGASARATLVRHGQLEEGALPARRHLLSGLLLAALSPEFVTRLRDEAVAVSQEVNDHCQWFSSLGDPQQLSAGALVALVGAIPVARAHREAEGHHRVREQRTAQIRGLRGRSWWVIAIWVATVEAVVRLNGISGQGIDGDERALWLFVAPALIYMLVTAFYRRRFSSEMSDDELSVALHPSGATFLGGLGLSMLLALRLTETPAQPTTFITEPARTTTAPAATTTPASTAPAPAQGQAPATQRVTITAGVANVRHGPSTASSVIKELTRGENLPLLERQGEWLRVDLTSTGLSLSRDGWVHQSVTSEAPSSPKPKVATAPVPKDPVPPTSTDPSPRPQPAAVPESSAPSAPPARAPEPQAVPTQEAPSPMEQWRRDFARRIEGATADQLPDILLGYPSLTQTRDGVVTQYYDSASGTIVVYLINGRATLTPPGTMPAAPSSNPVRSTAPRTTRPTSVPGTINIEGASRSDVIARLGQPSGIDHVGGVETWYYDNDQSRVYFVKDRATRRYPRE